MHVRQRTGAADVSAGAASGRALDRVRRVPPRHVSTREKKVCASVRTYKRRPVTGDRKQCAVMPWKQLLLLTVLLASNPCRVRERWHILRG